MAALLGSAENRPVVDGGTMRTARSKPRTLSGAPLSRSVNEELACEFYSSFYEHYLPRRFIEHYVYFNGADYHLTEQEMVDCNPGFNLFRERYKGGGSYGGEKGRAFASAVLPNAEQLLMRGVFGDPPRTDYVLRPVADVREVRTVPLQDFDAAAGAMTNGTLGNFTAKLRKLRLTLSRGSGGRLESWNLQGEMSFFDIWDFDPKPFFEAGRSRTRVAELKVRAAFATLPGTRFNITSPYVPFWYGSDTARVHWLANGKEVDAPKHVGDSAFGQVASYAPALLTTPGLAVASAFSLFLDLMPTE